MPAERQAPPQTFRIAAPRFLLHLGLLVGLSSLGLAALGCGETVNGRSGPDSAADPPAVSEEIKAADQQTAGPEAEQSVSVTLAPWNDILQAAKAEGRPAVIDVWSLSCEPCLKEFPGLVQLHQQWGERVHCVSANIDFDGRRTRPPESYETKVLEFLRLKKAGLANYLCTTPSDQVYKELDIDSIPAVIVFDATGKEVARFVDAGETLGFTYKEDVIPFVRQMLAGDAAPSEAAAPSDE